MSTDHGLGPNGKILWKMSYIIVAGDSFIVPPKDKQTMWLTALSPMTYGSKMFVTLCPLVAPYSSGYSPNMFTITISMYMDKGIIQNDDID